MDKSSFKYKLFKTVIVQGFIPLVFVLLTPIRIVFDFFTITHPDFFSVIIKPREHQEKVKDVQKQVS